MNVYRECTIERAIEISSLFSFSVRNFKAGYRFSGESHDFYEIVCVIDGSVGVVADKDIYVLSKGQMILHRCGEFHNIWSHDDSTPEIIILSFSARAFPKMSKRIYTLREETLNAFCKIEAEAKTAFDIKTDLVRGIKNPMLASKVVKGIEFLLLDIFIQDEGSETRYIDTNSTNYNKIISVMERGVGAKLTVKDIASACNMSVPTVERTMFRYLNCGAMHYYTHLKMKRAQELLSHGESVKSVAVSLGFANQNYFSSAYKKWCGVPPSAHLPKA